MTVARRVYLYVIAFVALGMLVTGLTGIVELGFESVVERIAPPTVTLGTSDPRGRLSFSVSFAAIGLVAWLIHWWFAQRYVARDGADRDERRSVVRALFINAVGLVGGLILLFAAQGSIADLTSLALGLIGTSQIVEGRLAEPLSSTIVVGMLLSYYRTIAAADRAAGERPGAATIRRWATYVPSFVAFFILAFAVAGLIGSVWQDRVLTPGSTSIGASGLAFEVSGRVGSILAGLAVWLVVWAWSSRAVRNVNVGDRNAESRSILRKVYVYLVLAAAVTWTIWNLGQILYGLTRTMLLGSEAIGGWVGLVDRVGVPLAAAVVFGVAWVYHARVVAFEAGLLAEERRQATIRWLYAYLVCLVSIVMFALGIGGALATALDYAVQPSAIRPENWWADRISLFSTLAIVAVPLWYGFWSRLQREAADPGPRRSIVRRIYLFVAIALGVLTLLTSGAYSLYQVMRLALGERWSSGNVSELVTAACAAAVAGILVTYHLRVLRHDAATGATVGSSNEALAVALIRAESPHDLESAIAALRAANGVEVHIVPTDAERTGDVRRVLGMTDSDTAAR